MKAKFKKLAIDFLKFLRWIAIASATGLIVGAVGVAFVKGLALATNLRTSHPICIFGLPFAGILIVALYKWCKYENDQGTNGVIAAIHAKSEVPFRMAPLIFVSTLLTHLFGGSAGREGAALQLGGSIGNQIGRLLKRNDRDKRTLVACGMSAAFSSIFGTPMAAVIFALEVNSVGIMQYSALVPCVFASLVASALANRFGVFAEHFGTVEVLRFQLIPALKICLLGILVAMLSVAFCKLLHVTGDLYKKWFQEAIAGEAAPYAFILKMLFTALTLGAGFKGGEIVPSFAIGATFGCLFGTLVGLPPSLCAAIAMISMFCGVTNSPIASMIIGFELFGFDIMKYLLICVSISYALSGYYSLYREQRIMYSKSEARYVNHETK